MRHLREAVKTINYKLSQQNVQRYMWQNRKSEVLANAFISKWDPKPWELTTIEPHGEVVGNASGVDGFLFTLYYKLGTSKYSEEYVVDLKGNIHRASGYGTGRLNINAGGVAFIPEKEMKKLLE